MKKDLRKKYLELRKTLSQDEVSILSKKIFENFILQFKPYENQKVHIFLSISKLNEIDTSHFINYFFENKIRVFIPKVVGSNLISVELTPQTEMTTSNWGILEPTTSEDSGENEFDFIVTPLLYCDNQGNRIGYGKGFYDQFFSSINENKMKIGINYFSPLEKVDNVFEQDIPLNYLITPTETLSFGGVR